MTDAILSTWTSSLPMSSYDFCAFSKTKEEAEELLDRVWKEAERKGVVVHENFRSSEFEFLAFLMTASVARSC